MPHIRPLSDFRVHYNQVSEFCRKNNEPVFITRNGYEDLVVMSHALYTKQQALLEWYRQKLYAMEKEVELDPKSESARPDETDDPRHL